MRLDELPVEILLQVYEQGGTELLASGLPLTCKRLRAISFDTQLWNDLLTDIFQQCCYTDERIITITSFREFFYEQKRIDRKVARALNALVYGPGTDCEGWVVKVIPHRLRATVELEKVVANPPTIAHYNWASWLLEAIFRTEGIYRLLDLSTDRDFGNLPIKNPLKHLEALLFLRLGQRPTAYINALSCDWRDRLGEDSVDVQLPVLIDKVQELGKSLNSKKDFFSTLLKSAMFVHVANQIWDGEETRLVTFPMATFCCVTKSPNDVLFVDFSRDGKLRTPQDIRDRLAVTNTPPENVKYGISFYDLLATVYVWHTRPSANRQTILELIEHAALQVNMRKQKQFPGLYLNLVKRIIQTNIADVDINPPVPLSRQVTGNNLQPGMVVTLVEMGPDPAVILEVFPDSCTVLRGRKIDSVLSSRIVPGYDGPLTTVAGLVVPDIDVDLGILGEYFISYDAAAKKFIQLP